MEISVVIPAYNEEKNIGRLYAEIIQVLKKLKKEYELIFIEDGSTDNTLKILTGLAEKDKCVKVIIFRTNFGQTAAFDAGFKNSKGKIVISMDADLQNDPKDIPALLKKLDEGYDVACGWRHKRDDSLSKIFFSAFAKKIRNIIAKDKIKDSGCSLRAYRKYCLVDFDLYGEMHRFIPTLLLWKGFKIADVKVNHRPRIYGKSKYGLKRLVKGFLDLLVVKFWMQYSARPIHLFGGGGLLLFVLGSLMGFGLVIGKFFWGLSLVNRTSPLLAVLLIILGIQLVLSGIIADISMKNYYKNKPSYSIEKIIN